MPQPVDYKTLPFDQQVAFFLKKLNLPTERWVDVWRDAHDSAFMVAGAQAADLLQDFREAIDKAITQGTTLHEFRKEFDEIVARHGWSYKGTRGWRTRVIYETNLRASYQAGRWAQIQAGKARRPYLLYKHSDSVTHPRPLHVSWDGLILEADDPWWRTHWPPNGWGCKCRAFALRKEDLAKYGKNAPGPAPDDGTYKWVDKVTGEEHEIPAGIDPGWDYAPGATRRDLLKGQLRRKKITLDPELRGLLDDFVGTTPPPVPPVEPPPPPPAPPAAQPWAEQANKEVVAWHDASFDRAPDWLKQAIGRHAVTVKTVKGGAYCRFGKNGYIGMGAGDTLDKARARATWRHEYGHWLDHRAGVRQNKYQRSMDGDFLFAMEDDAKDLKGLSGLGRKSKKQAARVEQLRRAYDEAADAVREADDRAGVVRRLFDELELNMDEVDAALSEHTLFDMLDGIGLHVRKAELAVAIRERDAQGLLNLLEMGSAPSVGDGPTFKDRIETWHKGHVGNLSDLFSAATKKKVEGCGSHSAAYYRGYGGAGKQATECMANLTSMYGDGNPFWAHVVERFTPRMSALFKDIANEL